MSFDLQFSVCLYAINSHFCLMKKILVVSMIIIAMAVKGQEANHIPFFKKNTNIDLALSFGKGQFSNALSFNKYHPIGKKGNFKIGYGLRSINYFSDTKAYKTAPAKLTSGVQNPSALFKDNIIENIDTIILNKAQVNYINLTINLQYTFFKKLDIEFSIDAIGFSFGGRQNGSYNSSRWNTINGPIPSTVQADPTRFNLLLVSDNDLGNLYSEILARYHLNRHISIKAGASFQFIEYSTTRKLRLNNDRFRYKSFIPMLGVSYWL